MFLSPSLSSFTVYCPAADHAINLTTAIPHLLPNLRRFKLKHPELIFSPSQLQLVRNTLLSLNKLTYINLNFPSISMPFDSELLTCLSQFPDLTKLALGLDSKLFNDPWIKLVDGFRFLEVLKLIWWDKASTSTVVAIVKTIVSPRFKVLSLHPPGNMDSADFYPLFKSTAIHRSLITLELSCRDQIRDTFPAEYLLLRPETASLQPLFSLSRLEKLILTGFYIAFTGSLIETMAASWPQLTALMVNQLYKLDDQQVDILHLHPLATRCRHLTQLHIPFCSPHTTTDAIPPLTIRSNPTDKLFIFESWTNCSNDVIAVAILHSMFGSFNMLPDHEYNPGSLVLAAKKFMMNLNEDGTIKPGLYEDSILFNHST